MRNYLFILLLLPHLLTAQVRISLPRSTTGATVVGGGAVSSVNSMTGAVSVEKAHNESHIGLFMAKPGKQPTRIILKGTSIANFANSSVKVAAATLQHRFGSAGEVRQLGVYGGTYNPSGGYKKRYFGGSGFLNLILEQGQSPLVQIGYCKRIVLVYTKEATTGAAFTVSIDGGAAVSLTSSAATQSYNNEYVVDLPYEGMHSIVVNPPTGAGYAILERVEFLLNKPGIIIEDATLGSFGVHDMLTLHSPTISGNADGLPISGYNGVDAVYGRTGVTKGDAFFVDDYTNDANNADWTNGNTRMAQKTLDGLAPVIFMNDLPAITSLDANGVQSAERQAMTAFMRTLSYTYPNLSFIDAVSMVKTSPVADYQAKYFPAGEQVHYNDQGQEVSMGPMFGLLGLTTVGVTTSDYVQRENEKPARVSETVKQVVNRSTAVDNRLVLGKAINLLSNQLDPLFVSTSEVNLLQGGTISSVASSTTIDSYGPYVTNGTAEFQILQSGTSIKGFVTITLLARRRTASLPYGVTVNNFTSNKDPQLIYAPASSTVISSLSALQGVTNGNNFARYAGVEDAIPVYITVQAQLHPTDTDQYGMTLSTSNLDVYGAWIVPGRVASIAFKAVATRREIGPPLPMNVDLSPDQVIQNQTYTELVGSVYVEKIATTGYCVKLLETGNPKRAIYRSPVRASPTFFTAFARFPNTMSAYDPAIGGQSYPSPGNAEHEILLSGNWVGQQYTLLFRNLSPTNAGLKIDIYNGGTNYRAYLQADGTWSTTSATIPTVAGEINAITFTMPATTTNTGTNPALYVEVGGTLTSVTLTLGKSACF